MDGKGSARGRSPKPWADPNLLGLLFFGPRLAEIRTGRGRCCREAAEVLRGAGRWPPAAGSPSVITSPGGSSTKPCVPPIKNSFPLGLGCQGGTSGCAPQGWVCALSPDPRGAQRRDCAGPPRGVPRAPVPAAAGPVPLPTWSPQWLFVPLPDAAARFFPPLVPSACFFPSSGPHESHGCPTAPTPAWVPRRAPTRLPPVHGGRPVRSPIQLRGGGVRNAPNETNRAPDPFSQH